jgi:hypothetical protein
MPDPLPLQCQRNARAGEFTWASTIKDNLLRWRYFYVLVLLKSVWVNANRAGNRHWRGSIIAAALQIHE